MNSFLRYFTGLAVLLKIFLTLSITLYVTSTEFSQTNINSIRGRVLDAITDEPIVNANVFISKSVWGTTTDNNGNFNLKNIPAGNHQLVVSIIGYNIEMQVITLEYGSELTLEFNLKEKAYELNEISVIAEIPEDWFDNLEIFKKFFLGQSGFAMNVQ